MTIGLSQCAICKHFDRKTTERNVCKAFPDGIPDDIILNRVLHNEAIEGDNDFQFTPISDAYAVYQPLGR